MSERKRQEEETVENTELDNNEAEDQEPQGGDQSEAEDYRKKIEDMQKALASLQKERDEILGEAIERRHKLKEERGKTDTLEDRVKELERLNHEATLKSVRLEAVTKHSLPADAINLLGDDPDEVDNRAATLAQLLSERKGSPTPATSSESNSRRTPSGGRKPNSRPSYDIDELVLQYS